MLEEPKTICQVCHEFEAKYKCPECGTRTCSLACTRFHECAFGVAAQKKADADEGRPHEDDPSDDGTRLAALYSILDDPRVSLSDEDVDQLVRTYLTPQQADEFHRQMRSGELLRQCVSQWTPWWEAARVVDEVDERDERRLQIPTSRAAPCVRCSLLAFVFTDVLVMRRYQGDVAGELFAEAARTAELFAGAQEPQKTIGDEILRLFAIAASKKRVGSESDEDEDEDEDDYLSPDFCVSLLDDVVKVFQSKQHVVHALNELQDVVEGALLQRSPKNDRKLLRAISRKIDFHAQWLLSLPIPDYSSLCVEIEREAAAARSSLDEQRQ